MPYTPLVMTPVMMMMMMIQVFRDVTPRRLAVTDVSEDHVAFIFGTKQRWLFFNSLTQNRSSRKTSIYSNTAVITSNLALNGIKF
jgi:hypothetical protein